MTRLKMMRVGAMRMKKSAGAMVMKSKAKASKCSMMAKSSMQKADDIEMADESAMPTLQKRTSEPVGYAAVVSC